MNPAGGDPTPPIPSGLRWLDVRAGCELLPGDALIVAGRTSVGKSHVSLMLAHARAQLGHSTVVVSLEDQAARVTKRLAAGYAHERVYLAFPDAASSAVGAIVADAADVGASMVCIDYVQLTRWDGAGQPWSRMYEIDRTFTALRRACAERGMVLCLLAQCGRPADMSNPQPFPSLYEMADAPRVLASKADVVLMLGVDGGRTGIELCKAKDAPTGGRVVLVRTPQGALREPDAAEDDVSFGRKEETDNDW